MENRYELGVSGFDSLTLDDDRAVRNDDHQVGDSLVFQNRTIRKLIVPLAHGQPLRHLMDRAAGLAFDGAREPIVDLVADDERSLRQPKAFPMLPLGLAVVRRYAAERAELERIGRKKSDFDLMIACTAIEHDATLATHDGALKDGAIGGLVVENWLELSP